MVPRADSSLSRLRQLGSVQGRPFVGPVCGGVPGRSRIVQRPERRRVEGVRGFLAGASGTETRRNSEGSERATARQYGVVRAASPQVPKAVSEVPTEPRGRYLFEAALPFIRGDGFRSNQPPDRPAQEVVPCLSRRLRGPA